MSNERSNAVNSVNFERKFSRLVAIVATVLNAVDPVLKEKTYNNKDQAYSDPRNRTRRIFLISTDVNIFK